MEEIIRIDNLIAEVNNIRMLSGFHMAVNNASVQGLYIPKGSVKNALGDILRGAHLPISGDFFYRDKGITYDDFVKKIYMIEPKSKLIEDLSVANNIFVIREGFSEQILEDRSLNRQAERLFVELKVELSTLKTVKELTRFEKVLVELVKAVGLGRELIVLKDCASFLSEIELEKLGEVVNRLAEGGCSFVYMDSFIEMLNKLTRQIVWVKHGRNKWIFQDTIPQFMLERVHEFSVSLEAYESRKCVMEFNNLTTSKGQQFDLKIYEGEIINIIDCQGHYLDLIRQAVCGEIKLGNHNILLEGVPFSSRNMSDTVDLGVGYINDNPTQTMLIKDMSALDNLCYIVSRKIKGFWMQKRFKNSILLRYQDKFELLDESVYIEDLSIYDRQRLVYYKWHVYKPKVMFIYRPFSSIDRDLHQLTYELITEFTKLGTAIILLTTNETDMKIDCRRYDLKTKKNPLFSKK
jgi:ribose transport system ATP-binding protein